MKLSFEAIQAPPFQQLERGRSVATPRQGIATFARHLQRSLEVQQGLQHPAARPATNSLYRVNRGDTLSAISLSHLREQGHSVTTAELYRAVEQIAQENSLNDPDRLYPGQELDLSALDRWKAGPAANPVHAQQETAERTAPASPLPNLFQRLPGIGGPSPLERPLEGFPRRHSDQDGLHKALAPARKAAQQYSAAQHPSEPSGVNASARNDSSVDSSVRNDAGNQGPAPWSQLIKEDARLTSEFGMRDEPFTGEPDFHEGIDLATEPGTRIYPYAAGRVVFSGWKSGYGNVVDVLHADGTQTRYGHNARNLVDEGQWIQRRTPLAVVGSSGRSTGPHLHFELHQDGVPVDPVPHLESKLLHVAQTL